MAEEMYICSQCGKESKQKTKFCSECGGSMDCYSTDQIKFVCEKCGKEFPEKWNFCHDCAGRIVTTVPYTYSCSKCGRESSENTKFCSECGGKVVRHGGVIGQAKAPEAAEPPAQPAAQNQPEFCPGCGQTSLVNGFCTNCGYQKGN